MKLAHLLKDIAPLKVVGDLNFEIRNLIFDSRKVQSGDIFFAIRGTQVDGHQFINKALEKGAALVICEEDPEQYETTATNAIIQVASSADAMGLMAAAFFDDPSKHLQLIGVTGTNGKTTTVTLLFDLFSALGFKCGLISTVENRIGEQLIPATHTTPDAIRLQALISDMLVSGCDYVFMEVSSHAVDQRRIAGLHFSGAVFTNMSHDHLDYHETFANYIAAKKRFFDDLPKTAFALVNTDDKRGMVMVQNTKAKVCTYSLLRMADFKGRIIENSLLGLQLEINQQEVFTRFIGDFNAYNLLAGFGTAILLGQADLETLRVISKLKAAEGRFDYVRSHDHQTVGIIDYAHTPDALDKVLQTIQKVKPPTAQVITVVGCGGDRDKAKRPEMAKIAIQWSNQVIFTSDNPRSENPDQIIKDMETGIPLEKHSMVLSITDRRQAIKTACRLAQKGDLILVAGKGHEKYQEIQGLKHPFDDKEILKEEFKIDN